MNQTVETYLRIFVDYVQDDWKELLLFAELVINNRIVAATKVSPFFLEHRYHVEPLDIQGQLSDVDIAKSPIQKADVIVRKLKEVQE
jgi:hypothetical protein